MVVNSLGTGRFSLCTGSNLVKKAGQRVKEKATDTSNTLNEVPVITHTSLLIFENDSIPKRSKRHPHPHTAAPAPAPAHCQQ